MKKIFLGFFAIILLLSCNKDNDDNDKIQFDYLIFGRINGECIGEICIEIFKITETSLFEDTLDSPVQGFEFVALENAKFEQVKDLIDFFPRQLLNQNETVFGCPNCLDQGELFIQISKNGIIKTWSIDQFKNDVPSYLHNFMDKVNEKIAIINN